MKSSGQPSRHRKSEAIYWLTVWGPSALLIGGADLYRRPGWHQHISFGWVLALGLLGMVAYAGWAIRLSQGGPTWLLVLRIGAATLAVWIIVYRLVAHSP